MARASVISLGYSVTMIIEPYMKTGFGEFLQLQPLTLCPIDKAPIDVQLLTDEELQWLNGYHARVYEELSPLLDEAHRLWLQEATAPLARG